MSSHGVTNHGDRRWAQQGHTDAGLLQHPNASGQVGVPVLEGPAPGENLTSSGSWLPPGTAPAFVAIWAVNQGMNDLFCLH